ncbi:MAG: SO2930 family diheme c-type cytochrome [Pirellulales bacterium]
MMPRSRAAVCAALAAVVLVAAGCRQEQPVWEGPPPTSLAEYGLFVGNGSTQQPTEGVIPYDVNSELFSDYAEKYRFIKLPPGGQAVYHPDEVFDLPVGTILAKTFAIPHDRRDLKQGERLIETRILMHREDGWVGLPYVWNENRTDAKLELAGGTVDVEWIHDDGQRLTNNYIVPNANQCKGCHKSGDRMIPIGPKARHLNRDFAYAGGIENQFQHWEKAGVLARAPAPADAPRLAVWDDPESGTLDERARAWLEINCAHCHHPDGPAANSGLDLMASQTNPTEFGVLKSPVAAGRGSGGLLYDIVPGKPDASILMLRIESTDPDIMMPELGKRLIHEEGVALVREWIAAMEPSPEVEARRPLASEEGRAVARGSAKLRTAADHAD